MIALWIASWLAGVVTGAAQTAVYRQPAARSAPLTAQAAAPAIASTQAAAPASGYSFESYKQWLLSRAIREGVRPATAQAYIPTLRLNRRAMELDRSPSNMSDPRYAPPPFAPYRREHVTASLISRGQNHYARHWANLQRVEARYGVDTAVMMAIYGHETSYGSYTGGFDLLDVLASLAYEGRRRAMFESEFIGALKLIDIGVPRWRLKGSYAGATGYPQFMPTTVLRLRADGDGDGIADVWSNEVDGLASIGNYLREAGWKPGIPWGVPVNVPATLNRNAIRPTLQATRCPRVFARHSRWLTMREWRALGVQTTRRGLPETELATLMEPDGPNATAYLLTNNYRAILDYNCSNFYALSVGLLADAIARR